MAVNQHSAIFLYVADLNDVESLSFASLGRTRDARERLATRDSIDARSDRRLALVLRGLRFGARHGLTRSDAAVLAEHLVRAISDDALEDEHCQAADGHLAESQTDLRELNATAESWRQRALPEGA